MAEARRHFRARRIWLLLGAVGLSACIEFNNLDEPTPPRLLDKVCRSGGCTTSGAVRRTTGPTADTIGYHFGPGVGSLSIPLYTLLPGDQDTTDLDSLQALVAGHGKISIGAEDGACCGSVSKSVPGEYNWVDFDLESNGEQSADGGESAEGMLVLSVAGDGTEFDLADLRYTPSTGCSVVAPGAAY
jgi:hypothetical protein